MGRYLNMTKKVIQEADVLLLLLDARYARESLNKDVESMIRCVKKPIIYVLTKSDLVAKERLETLKRQLKPSVFVSAREHFGSKKLKERIIIAAHKHHIDKDKDILVGVLGYPNVGKSSVINMLKGKHSASTSVLSGHTKRLQKFRIDRKIMMIDTPGVIPHKEKSNVNPIIIGAVDYGKLRDPETILIKIMRQFPGKIEKHYGYDKGEDEHETLEKIALEKHMLLKEGLPDTRRLSVTILKDLQKGKIHI